MDVSWQRLTINKKAPLPVYHQIREQLESIIEEDWVKDGHHLPSENEISEKLNISRMTVRKAIDEMVKRGLVIREKGRRSRVIKKKVHQSLLKINSFTEGVQEEGFSPRIELLEFAIEEADERVQNKLDLSDPKVINILRLRWIDDIPAGLQRSYIPYEEASALMQYKHLLEKQSLYSLLKEYCQLEPRKVYETLEIRRAGSPIHEWLQVSWDDPLFYVEAVVYSQQGPMEFVKASYRSNLFKFHVVNEIK